MENTNVQNCHHAAPCECSAPRSRAGSSPSSGPAASRTPVAPVAPVAPVLPLLGAGSGYRPAPCGAGRGDRRSIGAGAANPSVGAVPVRGHASREPRGTPMSLVATDSAARACIPRARRPSRTCWPSPRASTTCRRRRSSHTRSGPTRCPTASSSASSSSPRRPRRETRTAIPTRSCTSRATTARRASTRPCGRGHGTSKLPPLHLGLDCRKNFPEWKKTIEDDIASGKRSKPTNGRKFASPSWTGRRRSTARTRRSSTRR